MQHWRREPAANHHNSVLGVGNGPEQLNARLNRYSLDRDSVTSNGSQLFRRPRTTRTWAFQLRDNNLTGRQRKLAGHAGATGATRATELRVQPVHWTDRAAVQLPAT